MRTLILHFLSLFLMASCALESGPSSSTGSDKNATPELALALEILSARYQGNSRLLTASREQGAERRGGNKGIPAELFHSLKSGSSYGRKVWNTFGAEYLGSAKEGLKHEAQLIFTSHFSTSCVESDRREKVLEALSLENLRPIKDGNTLRRNELQHLAILNQNLPDSSDWAYPSRLLENTQRKLQKLKELPIIYNQTPSDSNLANLILQY